MSVHDGTSQRTRSLIAALLGLGLSGLAAGIANVGNPTNASSTPTVTVEGATTLDATPTSGPATSPSGPQEHVSALLIPDPVLHPGAIDRKQRRTKICAADFRTSSVRPNSSYTTKLKRLELGDGGPVATKGVTYTITGERLPGVIGDYELDHLISLELGGNPTDPRNLWLQPWERKGQRFAGTGTGAESKDVVENRLHREVCAGTITLAEAQRVIASDWTTAK